jgi:membrane-associated phospholipid phosphatase
VTNPGQRPQDELVPHALRPVARLIIGLCIVILAALSAVVAHGTQPTSVDRAVANLLQPSSGPGGFPGGFHGGPAESSLSVLLGGIGQLGGPVAMTVLTCLLCYCCIAMRRLRGAMLLATAVIAASLLTEFVLKPMIDRTYAGALSFPSGHSTAAFALAAGVAVLLIDPPGARMPGSLRVVLSVAALATACLVAAGLVASHQHYFTDTVAGAAVGIAVALTTALALDRLAARHAARPVADAPRPSAPARLG